MNEKCEFCRVGKANMLILSITKIRCPANQSNFRMHYMCEECSKGEVDVFRNNPKTYKTLTIVKLITQFSGVVTFQEEN